MMDPSDPTQPPRFLLETANKPEERKKAKPHHQHRSHSIRQRSINLVRGTLGAAGIVNCSRQSGFIYSTTTDKAVCNIVGCLPIRTTALILDPAYASCGQQQKKACVG